MIGWIVEALVASAALMLVVLAVRGPVRRAFGAELAYALWAIPALRLILPPLPQEWHAAAVAPIAAIGRQASVMIVPLADTAMAIDAPAPAGWLGSVPSILVAAWIVGALAFLGWQLARYVRFRMALMARAVPLDRQGRVAIVESAAATGPLAFGIVRRVVAFPPDFAARYDADERDLALAHELGHHARGDLVANWIALAVLALHWFNPVAWIAYRAYRADQEMANDAGVLARLGPGARHAYGCAIVKAAHGRALTPACHLHTIKDLKGRLRMLGRKRASRGRVTLGAAGAMGLAIGALALTASGTQAAERVRAKMEKATGVELAALDPVAAFQAAPAVAAPPAAPDAGKARTSTRVVVTRDGKTETYEGAAADAYIAAHPVPTPPTPPASYRAMAAAPAAATVPAEPAYGAVPPVPPMPDVPVVAGGDCGTTSGSRRQMVVHRVDAGKRTMMICTDRIEAAAKAAADAGVRAEAMGLHAERDGMMSAIASLRQARASMARDRGLTGEYRAEALRGMDEAIAEMRAEMKETGRD